MLKFIFKCFKPFNKENLNSKIIKKINEKLCIHKWNFKNNIKLKKNTKINSAKTNFIETALENLKILQL